MAPGKPVLTTCSAHRAEKIVVQNTNPSRGGKIVFWTAHLSDYKPIGHHHLSHREKGLFSSRLPPLPLCPVQRAGVQHCVRAEGREQKKEKLEMV